MLTTPHAVSGATIGVLVSNPLVAIPVAVASHFVLDSVPHWQETLAPYVPTRNTYIRATLDLILATALVALISNWNSGAATNIWIGAVFANIPDLDSIVAIKPRLKVGIVKQYWDWHCRIQRETDSYWGLVPQLTVIILGIAISK